MNKIFKKFSFMMVIGLMAASITGCAKESDNNRTVAQINNYLVTIEDFKHEAGMTIPGASKELILQDIITKELLLQEAQKMKLDKNKLFMKEIEDYWKQALIKRLIIIKGNEFLAASKESNNQAKMKQAQISLENWINYLRKNAYIEEHKVVLNGIELKNSKNLVGGADGK